MAVPLSVEAWIKQLPLGAEQAQVACGSTKLPAQGTTQAEVVVKPVWHRYSKGQSGKDKGGGP